MANLGFDGQSNFNSQQVEDAVWQPIPAGDHLAIITESDRVPTRDGNGELVKLKLQIIEGPAKGRTIFDNINVVNRSPDAQAIGRARLKKVCEAVGRPVVSDSSELHDIPVGITIAVKKKTDGSGDFTNDIKKYIPRSQMSLSTSAPAFQPPFAGSPSVAPAAVPASGGPGGSAPPWAR